VLLVEHGKRCPRCSKTGHARKEVHGPCPLVNLASAAKAGHRLSATDAAEEAKEQLNVKTIANGEAMIWCSSVLVTANDLANNLFPL